MIDESHIERFTALFKGNERSFGQYMPKARVPMVTVKAAFTAEHVRAHLEGENGLGVVAIRDDDKCMFAAIDIDVHGPNGGEVDLLAIEQRVTRNSLPLVVCRSKSGGAHCYAFFREPTEASRIRLWMARWAGILGYPSAEIFPKQTTLAKKEGDSERPLGNWINLPYYHVAESERYALDGGKQVDFDYFLEMCEGRRFDLSEFEKGTDVDYANGPPCLQEMMRQKVDEGSRNTAVFQAAIYLKRAFADDWRQRVDEFSRVALAAPLGQRELRTICGSVGKKDYQYKCREEPCKSFCNKDLCKTREFGITAADSTANEIPLFDNVEKVVATPVFWRLTVKGQIVEVTTPELFNYDIVRTKVGEKLHIVLPRIKPQEWDLYLREIMAKVTVRHEMTQEDMIFQRICEYLKRIPADKGRSEDDRRDDLRRGSPTLISISNTSFRDGKLHEEGKQWFYAFKLQDFVEWLKRKKALPVPDHQMHTILYKVLGEESKRDKIRVGNTKISNVWCIPEESVENEAVPVQEIKSEF